MGTAAIFGLSKANGCLSRVGRDRQIGGSKSAATGAARNEAPRGSDLLRAIGDLRHKQDISSFFSSLLF
jgi:hypothetical protein